MKFSWIGLEIEGADVESVIGEGGFSVVYLANRGGEKLAFKVARGEEQMVIEQQTGCFNTMAQCRASCGIADIAPQPAQVLSCQYAKLKSIKSPGVIEALSSGEVAGVFYYSMPAISAPTLRSKMRERAASVSQLQEIASICAGLANKGEFHGDLKPDNVILPTEAPLLIDPGHYGPLVVAGVELKHCFISTPAYYPFYKPDDLFALGIMLWELVFGKHPCPVRSYSEKIEHSHCGPRLVEFVHELEKVSQYAFSSILKLRLPRDLKAELSVEQEACLLKGLRLKRSRDNKLELGEGFGNFGEFADSLSLLGQLPLIS